VSGGATGLPTLADPGYDGAGIGIHISVKQPADGRDLYIGTRTCNAMLRSLRRALASNSLVCSPTPDGAGALVIKWLRISAPTRP
jgi:hypothetical protein